MTDIKNLEVFKKEQAQTRPASLHTRTQHSAYLRDRQLAHFQPVKSTRRGQNSPYYVAGGEVMDFFENTAPDKYGCEFRQGQYDMAVEIIEALKQGKHYVTEAEVGIGKSYAYLAPLILLGRHMKMPVAVATSTISLQEQLASDVKKLSAMLGVDCDPVIAKGQTHYVCMKRAVRFMEEQETALDIRKDGTPIHKVSMADVKAIAAGLGEQEEGFQDDSQESQQGNFQQGGYQQENYQQTLLSAIKAGIEAGCGERKSFPFEIPDKTWSSINITAFNPGACRRRCSYVSQCPYRKMRDELLSSDFTICNQDLLTRHLLNMGKENGSPILNENLGAIVVDEAHNLEARVRSAVTVGLSEKQLESIVEGVARNSNAKGIFVLDRQTESVEEKARLLFTNMEAQRAEQIEAGRKAGMAPGYTDRYFFNDEDGAFALLKDLSDALSNLSDNVGGYYGYGRGAHRGISALDKLDRIAVQLAKFCGDMENHIVWICQGADGLELDFCPKDVAAISERLFFSGKHRMILTSATLTGSSDEELESQYSYLKSSLGFATERDMPNSSNGSNSGNSSNGSNGSNGSRRTQTMLGEPKQSPYDYDSHAMVYYAGDMPHPSKKHQKFVEMGTKRLMEILDISKGRALVLFTSKADLDEVAAELKRQKTPYHILTQRAGSSQAEVLKQFREDVNSVLLGTGAFWEGVSIEGESLSNVVIFRLPFPVPDPIIDYKCRMAKDKLMDVLVPEMVIKLKQGVGRLIRNATDKGIISIIDGRMGERSDAKYKQLVWDALPIKNRTSSLKKIRQFYEEEVLGIRPDTEEIAETDGITASAENTQKAVSAPLASSVPFASSALSTPLASCAPLAPSREV